MKKQHVLLLLHLIKRNGDVDTLINEGYDFAQVTRKLRYLKNNNYVEQFSHSLNLTEKGEEEIYLLNNELNRKGSDRWISPLDVYKIEKMHKNDIYLPQLDKTY